MMISKNLQKGINDAVGLATLKDHEYCSREHLIAAILDQEDIKLLVESCNVDPIKIKQEIISYLDSNFDKKNNKAGPLKVTGSLDKLLQMASMAVNSSGRLAIEPTDIVVELLKADNCQGRYIFEKYGIDKLRFTRAINNFNHVGKESHAESGKIGEKNQPQKNDYLVDLNLAASSGKIDKLIGRNDEVSRVIQVLCRRKKNNPILVGEPGVGKTAIAEGLAYNIVKNKAPLQLRQSKVYSLNIGSMIAGTKFRGDFEERMKDVIKKIRTEKGAILFIDEIHTIIGAGMAGGGSMDASNMLKPILTSGEFRCIGATTYKEYNHIFEKEPALSRRFQKVDVNEPSRDETIQIIEGVRTDLESHHGVRYTNSSIKLAVDLSIKYINDRFLPDKAIDLLDEAGSFVKLKGGKSVSDHIIEKTIAKITKIPERTVSKSQKEIMSGLSSDLKSKIFGQDQAISAVVSAIELASAGLRSGDKPIGSFLFCGPTGVGKTELCRQLSKSLGINFIRFDMSEYMEKHSVSRLIGAPPGYVGFNEGGLLTDSIRKNPNSVVLLDEIEKAHPDVWNILLQVMDHGTLTDNNGKKADFRHAVLVMTSNVGARESTKKSLGLAGDISGVPSQNKSQSAIESSFSPEFRNRLDSIVWFNHLSKDSIMDVVDKYLKELSSQLSEKGISIDYSDESKKWLSDNGYSPSMGARPMIRLIQDKIKRPLSSEILYGRLENGGKVEVKVNESGPYFDFK